MEKSLFGVCPSCIASILYNSQMQNYNDRAGNSEVSLCWAVGVVFRICNTYICQEYV